MNKKRAIVKIILIFLIVFIYLAYNSLGDILNSIERSKSGLSKKSVQVGDQKIVYLEGGSGDAVILLHGFGDSKDAWVKFSRELTKKYRVIIPDLPGFGESTKNFNSSYSIPVQVARIDEFTKTIGLNKFHIAGNSMGGLISGLYSAGYPEKVLSLCLIDAGGIIEREPSGLAKEIVRGVNPLIVDKPEDFDRLLNFVFFKAPSIPGFIKSRLAEKAVSGREFNKKVFAEVTPKSQLEDKLKDIKAKTLVIWGDTDRVFPVSNGKIIVQKVKNSRLIVVKECGHLPMTEKPYETSKYYQDFIK